MPTNGGKKINVVTTTTNINSITRVEFKNILEETLDEKSQPIYNNIDVNNILRLYTDDVYWNSITRTVGNEYDFISNEFIFNYYVPIFIGKISNIIGVSEELIQRNINIQKLKERNINLKGVSKIMQNSKKNNVAESPIGVRVELNYPINLMHIQDNDTTTNRNIYRYNVGSNIIYNGLLMPSHNVSKKTLYGNRMYIKHPFKDIITTGFYNSMEPVRGEYMIFMSPHTYKLNDGKSILPSIYPYYGRDNKDKDRIIFSKNIPFYIKILTNYMRIVLRYAYSSTPLIYNNIVYRYIPERISDVVGVGNIVSPTPIGGELTKKDINKLASIINVNFNYYLSMSNINIYTWLNTLSAYNLEKVYYYTLHNIGNTFVDNILDIIKNKIKNKGIIATQEKSIIEAELERALFRITSIYTLGKDPILDTLTESDKKHIKYEIDRKKAYKSSINSNTCPHIKAVKDMVYGNYSASMRGLNILTKYMVLPATFKNVDPSTVLDIVPPGSGKKSTDIINCNNCKLPIVCPHVYHQYKLEHEYVTKYTRNSNTVLRDIKNFMIRNYTLMDNVSTNKGMYYCKICGGKVAEDNDILDIIPDVNLLGDYITPIKDEQDMEIDKLIYVYSSNIIKNNVTFKIIIDPKVIINTINRMIKQNLRQINDKLNAYTGMNDVHSKLHPYTIINVVMALAVIIINRKKEDILLVENKVAVTGGSVNKIQEIFNNATKIILQNKKVFDRNEIPMDHIKKLIIVTYKTLSGDITDYDVVSNINLQSLITVNPLYQYLHRHINLYNNRADISDTGRIVNLSPAQILSSNYKRKTFTGDLLDITPIKPPEHPINLHKEAVINNVFKEFVDNDIYTYPIDHINRIEYYENYAKLVEEESVIQQKFGTLKDRHIIQSTVTYKRNNPRKYSYNRYNVKLNRGYSKDGKKQVWDTFSYKSGKYNMGDKRLLELSSDTLIDVISKAGMAARSTSTKDNKDIVNALTQLDKIHNFYTYYQFRCPVSGLHEFVKNVCTKCKVTDNILQSESREYYAKYSKVYMSELFKLKSDNAYTLRSTIKYKKVVATVDKKYDNFEFINQIAKVFSIPYKVFLNIGLLEYVQYNHVVQGKINPYSNLLVADDVSLYYVVNQNKSINRISRIMVYINNMWRYYEYMLDFDQEHMHKDQYNILKKYAKYITYNGTKELRKILPNIHEEFVKFIIGTDNLSPINYGNKCLYYLAYTLISLTTIKSKNKDINNIASDFAKWYSKYIIYNENMLSMYDEDQLRRDNSSRYEQIRDQLDKLHDANANEALEIIQLYDPELAKEHGYKNEIEQNIADNSFEMSIDVDENNEIEPSDS